MRGAVLVIWRWVLLPILRLVGYVLLVAVGLVVAALLLTFGQIIAIASGRLEKFERWLNP